MNAATPANAGYPFAYPDAHSTRPLSNPVSRPNLMNAAAKDESASGLTYHAERRRGRGPGRTGLTDIKNGLSERDHAVLRLVDQHRFLTTNHIQRFLFHEHASPISAERTCRRVLERLERLSLLTRPIRRIGGLMAGSRSSVWMPTTTGRRLLNIDAGHGAVGHIREPGERFIAHYLAIADTRLQLLDADRAGLLETLDVQIEPKAWRPYLGSGGERQVLKPDLYAVTVTVADGKSSDYEDHWFIEVDRGTESIPTLLGQCRQYESYRSSGREQERIQTFPLVLWIVPDERRRSNLQAAIRRTHELTTELYRVTLPEQFLGAIRGATS